MESNNIEEFEISGNTKLGADYFTPSALPNIIKTENLIWQKRLIPANLKPLIFQTTDVPFIRMMSCVVENIEKPVICLLQHHTVHPSTVYQGGNHWGGFCPHFKCIRLRLVLTWELGSDYGKRETLLTTDAQKI
jgi:hypothetical protein